MLADIRAVAFDLDNTLWEVEPVIARAEERLFEWLHAHCPRIPQRFSVEDMRAARQQLALDEPQRAHDFTYLRIASLADHARDCGYDQAVAEQAFEVFFAVRNQVEVFDDVAPALRRLRTRYALGTLTNGNADLNRIGLATLFDLSLNSRDVGVAKPHPHGFRELATRMKREPAQILYVGDDPTLDVEAARAVGMSTAWMNRRGTQWPGGMSEADLVVTDCLELAKALGV